MEQKNYAKYTFFYLLALVALIFTAIACGQIVFQIINKTLVDAIDSANFYSSSAMKFGISALLIAAPIFYVMTQQINKALRSGALGSASAVRRWLTYLILFASALVVIGWLIATVNIFLNGELTWKFILKDLTILIIAAVIFTYYLYDIKRQAVDKPDTVVKLYFYCSLVLVTAAFVASWWFVESPTEARLRKYDDAIMNDFSQIDAAINNYYWTENKTLPADLAVLQQKQSYHLSDDMLKGPDNSSYEYKLIDKETYQLCATFKTDTENLNKDLDYQYRDQGQWSHGLGYQCLERAIIITDRTALPLKS